MPKSTAIQLLKHGADADPEFMDPPEMIAYLQGIMRAALHNLGVEMSELVGDEPEYPTHGEQVASPNHSDYLGGDLSLRSGW